MTNETLYIPKAFRKSIIILFLILPITVLIKIDLINQGGYESILVGLIISIAFLYSIFGMVLLFLYLLYSSNVDTVISILNYEN